ncbi:BTAD domain-containing putative transcriptional regulator [Kribbella sp. NPDC056861]|uniref:AfsR/SARP family transcriptional regulator n=1 Tax=Kribbella sp. NPDC056861 TaxID=3154857 RepID=UPI00343AC03D
MEFRLLGPFEASAGDQLVAVPSGRVRALLIVLLVHANRSVSRSELTELLWEDAPEDPRSTVQTYVSRLRNALGDQRGLIRTTPTGYSISVDAKNVDLLRFRQAVAEAATTQDAREAARLLTTALALWRGDPESDGGGRGYAVQAGALLDERLDALEQLNEARLRLGEHALLVPELQTLTSRHPLRERFWAQLMIAQYGSSRRGDALTTYADAAKELAARLGLDPGPELRRVHQAVLTSDPALEYQAPSSVDEEWVRLCQLPPDQPGFAGRTGLISRVEQTLLAPAGVPVAVLSGLPGAGKTALAVRVGHRLAGHFPDGQWYVELGPRRDPSDVLAELLRASGADPRRLPDETDRRAAALRSRLAGRQVLIVLDDAHSTAQVTPLLPGCAGSAVLVTSRSQLTGLGARFGARTLPIDMLEQTESLALLANVLGKPAVDAELTAVRELVELCGGLPLALRIAAANLATRPESDAGQYVAELRKGSRLDKLAIPAEPQNAVRAAFALSYELLRPDGRRCFRLLGSVPGIDFTADTAAALLGIDRGQAEVLMEEIAASGLLQRRVSCRYQFHDLLRLYSAELATADSDRDSAVLRLFAWTVRAADAATSLDHPRTLSTELPPGAEIRFDDPGAGRTWLDAERANLVALVEHATEQGLHEQACQLAETIRGYQKELLLLPELRRTSEAALASAQALNDPIAEALTRIALGYGRYYAGDPQGRKHHADKALELARRSSSKAGAAKILVGVSMVELSSGRLSIAVDLLTECLAMTADLDVPFVRSAALLNLSEISNQQGLPEAALGYANEALRPEAILPTHELAHRVNRIEAHRQLGDLTAAQLDLAAARALLRPDGPPHQKAWIATAAALVDADLGLLDEALLQAREGVRLTEQMHDPFESSRAHLILGSVLSALDQPQAAAAEYETALEQAERFGFERRAAEAVNGLARQPAGKR